MFVFEDIVTLDNRSIQRIIRECENEDLLLALKVSSDEVKEVIYRNMSTRMVETYKEEMEFMGPVRLRDVEEAQSKIVASFDDWKKLVKSSLPVAGEMILLSRLIKFQILHDHTAN